MEVIEVTKIWDSMKGREKWHALKKTADMEAATRLGAAVGRWQMATAVSTENQQVSENRLDVRRSGISNDSQANLDAEKAKRF